MIMTAESIIMNFGRYYSFFWNCQDFTSWFLINMSVPPEELSPTQSDRVTGSETVSGTGSSARVVCHATVLCLVFLVQAELRDL